MIHRIFVLAACVFLSACSSTPNKSGAAPSADAGGQAATTPAAHATAGEGGSATHSVAAAPANAGTAPRGDAKISVADGTPPRPDRVGLDYESGDEQRDHGARELTAKSIFFAYNDYSIKPEYQPIVMADARILMSLPRIQVSLEGNADERGSREYNLALGQKRAEALRKALKLLGVRDSELEAISFGKEKPRADCHEERCWAVNRRVDLAIRNTGETP